MRLSVALTALYAGFCTAQDLGAGFIEPVEYDIFNDPIHEQWYNMTASLDKRQDQRLNFRVASNIVLIAGYTYTYGAQQVGDTVDACTEHQGSNTATKGTCVKNAMIAASGYAIVGVLGYTGDTACVALLQSALGLANTVNGNQGQGPNYKRDDDAALSTTTDTDFNPPAFTYGNPDISDSVVDIMNHAIEVNQQQRAGAGHFGDSRDVSSLKKRCTARNGNLYTSGHYWNFANKYGMKLQCKNGCGDTNYNGQDMTNAIGAMVTAVYTSNDLNAQFTVYDKNNGRVFARCKFTFEDAPTDTCPEGIDGQGCNF